MSRPSIVDPRSKTVEHNRAPVSLEKGSTDYDEAIATTLDQHGYIPDASRQTGCRLHW